MHRIPLRKLLPALLLAPMLAGCSSRAPIATAPEWQRAAEVEKSKPKKDGSGKKGFFPLEPGNRWKYRHEIVIQLVPVSGPPVVLAHRKQDVLRELVCVETRGDREYVVERETITEPGNTYITWIRYRQDRSGLYEADIPASDPPACEPGGSLRGGMGVAPEPSALPIEIASIADPERRRAYAAAIEELDRRRAAARGASRTDRSSPATLLGVNAELQRLRYPLHKNQSWTISTNPDFTARVERHESLDLPAGKMSGWRVRLHNQFYQPNDYALFWYGKNGVLQFREGFRVPVRDPNGNPTGEYLTAAGGETLVELSLERRPDKNRKATPETASIP